MKKYLFVFLVGISVVNINAEEKFSFQTKPIMYIISGFYSGFAEDPLIFADIEFQCAMNDKFALFINPSFASGFRSLTEYYEWGGKTYYSANSLNLITGLLYHPYGTGLRGMYLGAFPIIGWGYINKNDDRIKDFLNIGYMAEAGYEWIFKNGFTITLGGGISKIYQIPSEKVLVAVNNPTVGNTYFEYNDNLYGVNLWKLPFDARLRFSIGYSF